jgi:hypothetical protein
MLRSGGGLAHPAGEQCSAKSKATGRRCERRVIGGGPCHVHGGAAKQVKAKREQRIVVAEARAAAAAEPVVLQRREPEELLIDLLDDVNRILQQIKSELHGNVVSPALLQAAGEWFDRTARVAKTVIDGDLSQRLHARMGWLAADRAATCWALLAAIVAESPLSAQQRLQLWESRFEGIRAVQDGSAPSRLQGDALHRFSDSLLEAAAVERAVADGVMPWDEADTEPEFEAESDVGGELVLFPSNGDGSVA